jgi:two-component sensor histidine kinase
MRLVRSLVDQVGGELSISGGQGAHFEIRLKNDEAEPVA